MRSLRAVGMVAGAPLAMLGFLLPFDGILAGVEAVVTVLGHAHGFVIIIGGR